MNEFTTSDPTIQKILDTLKIMEDARQTVIEAERAYEDTKAQATSAILEQAPNNNSEEILDLARNLYWYYWEIPVGIISAILDVRKGQVARVVGSGFINLNCHRCKRDFSHTITSRSDYIFSKSRFERGTHTCPDCERVEQKQLEQRLEELREQGVIPPKSKYERLQELKTMPYSEYLQTPEWKEKRFNALKRASYCCQECGANRTELHVHHLTYERRGKEKPGDLTVLCKNCHYAVHKEEIANA